MLLQVLGKRVRARAVGDEVDKLADEFPPVRFLVDPRRSHSQRMLCARRAFILIESANVDYADKVYKRFKF